MKKIIIRSLIFIAIFLMFVIYGKHIREATIKSAELVEITDDGYIISFNGEAHSYKGE